MNAKTAAPATSAAPKARRATVSKRVTAKKVVAPPPVDAKAAAKAQKMADALIAANKAKQATPTKAKPVEKKAAAPVVAKPAKTPKAEKVVVKFVPKMLPKGKLPFVVAINARPSSGSRLFAHTHAALHMLGMMDNSCPIVPKSAVLTVMGARALAYHLGEGNFTEAKDHGIRLTAPGLNKFRNRLDEGKVDGAMANEFMTLFLEGKPGNTGVQQGEIYQAAIG